MHNFRNLDIWKDSMELTTKIYKLTTVFPTDERFNLTSQIRRCAVSIPSNIAEGCGRGSDAQLAHFLNIAQGSAFELETQLYLANQLNFLNQEKTDTLVAKVTTLQKMMDGFKDRIS